LSQLKKKKEKNKKTTNSENPQNLRKLGCPPTVVCR
jgi:hypothetical protein